MDIQFKPTSLVAYSSKKLIVNHLRLIYPSNLTKLEFSLSLLIHVTLILCCGRYSVEVSYDPRRN